MLTTLATRYPATIHTCPMAPGLISPFLTIQEGLVPLETHLSPNRTYRSCQAASSLLFIESSQPPAHGARLFTNGPASTLVSYHSASRLLFQLEQRGEDAVLTSPETLDCESRQILSLSYAPLGTGRGPT